MYKQDITGSMAHAAMLGAQGIIPAAEAEKIIAGLEGILADIDSGELEIDMSCEDIHSFVEMELTERIGDAGKRLHTARSRNDQVAVDTRLYLRDRCEATEEKMKALALALTEQGEKAAPFVAPGYTHLQRAQPISFGHQLLAYAWMLIRDMGRLNDAKKRMNYSPLGAGALAGTTYPIDRAATAAALGFDGYIQNSLDAVSDRDFCVELAAALSLTMTHLSRLSEELILWSSWEFKFIELDEAYTTGSSIMPQKKNPDMAELIRGKTGRVYGGLMTLLTMLKGLPLAYNKDMQEDKEAIFDIFDTVDACLDIAAPMIATMSLIPENMAAAAAKGFINATDLADYMVKKGMPFRSAYKTVGKIVAYCIAEGTVLDKLSLETYKSFDGIFESDLYEEIDLINCMTKRTSPGGAGSESVLMQAKILRGELG
ncbi:MAG: argininosuccinate lyase [Oscillospiraceae bacterium]|nr:argininosuccinate lyase [Oscillospiraceae bacterium]